MQTIAPNEGTSSRILAELRQGERTTSELMASAGVSRNAVLCSIATLRRNGSTISDCLAEWSRHRGGHHEARWRLDFDRERPAPRSCAMPGCTTLLNSYNQNRYCLVHRHHVAARLLTWSTSICLEEVTTVDQLLALLNFTVPEACY